MRYFASMRSLPRRMSAAKSLAMGRRQMQIDIMEGLATAEWQDALATLADLRRSQGSSRLLIRL